jgi:hypothetical protein
MIQLKKIFHLLFLLSAFTSAAQKLAVPLFSHSAGFYPDSIYVSISSPDAGATVHYTLNGDEPTQLSPQYSSPLLIKNISAEPDQHSLIPTNPSFFYPVNGYDTARANSRGWLAPYTVQNKATVLRAKAFKPSFISSEISTSTYFIDPLLSGRYSLPVLSLSTNFSDLFSDSTGMYVYGLDTLSGGNYFSPGVEKKFHVELFDPAGALSISQDCGVRNHGDGGRYAPQKSLKLIARTQYGKDSFGLQLFPQSSTAEYKNFLLRNGGHRPDCFPRDDLAARIVSNMDFEVQNTRHVIVFINGEYWGIHAIKDVFDKHYLAGKYKFDPDMITMLELSGSIEEGLPGSNAHYLNMRSFAVNNDMLNSGNYNYIKTQMDVENFIDYQSAEIYFGNGDWPNNNIKFWRFNQNTFSPNSGIKRDGRWRWMMYDLDAGFGGDCSGIYPSHNALANATSTTGGNSTLLLRSLLVNPDFRNMFINRCADLLNTQFHPSRLSAIASGLEGMLSPEMTEHVNRWRYPALATTLAARASEVPSLAKWNSINSDLLDFINERPEKIRRQYMNYFTLNDTVKVTLNVNDTAAGRIRFSTLMIDRNTIAAASPPYPWTGTYFTSIPVPIKAVAWPGHKFSHWLNTTITNPDTVVFLNSDTSFTAVFDVDTSFHALHHLYINELSARNNNYSDEYGEQDDWFEFYNPNNFAVSIEGYYISDSSANKTKYRFSGSEQNCTVPAKGFLLLRADEQIEQGPLHCIFKLNGGGEALFLTLPDGITAVDSIVFGAQQSNHSWGRSSDGDSSWVDFQVPTPGRSNIQTEIIDETQPLFVFPSPAKNTDILHFNKPVTADIYNALGQKVISVEDKMELNIISLKPGVYLIRSSKGEIVRWIRL